MASSPKRTAESRALSDRIRLCYQDFATSAPSKQAGSQAAFARKVGVDKPRLSEWLSGRKHPTLPNLIAIAGATGRPIEWLATGRGPERLAQSENGDPLEISFYRHVVHALFAHHDAVASRHEEAWSAAFRHAYVPEPLSVRDAMEMATRDLVNRLGVPEELLARATKQLVAQVLADVEAWVERTESVDRTLRLHEEASRLLRG